MKKIKILMFIVCLIVPMLLFTHVHAYNNGLLEGKSPTSIRGANLPQNVTDSNLNTSSNLVYSSGSSWVEYTLDVPTTITKVFLKSNTRYLVYVSFYSSSNQLLGSISAPNDSDSVNGAVTFVNFQDVKKVRLFNNETNKNKVIYEFDVYDDVDTTPPSEVSQIVSEPSENQIKIRWINPTDEDFDGVEIYRDDVKIATLPKERNEYTDTSLSMDTRYKYKIVTKDNTGNRSTGVEFFVRTLNKDETPPAEIRNLKSFVYADRIKFTWENPPDVDFYEVRIYRDGKQIATAVTPANQITSYDLSEHTTYTFVFYTVDTSGNVSSGISVSVKTKGKPIGKVSGLSVQDWETSADITFNRHPDYTVTSYNIYLDGQKVGNTNLLKYQLNDLIVGKKYKVQVTALNEWGESELSDPVEFTTKELSVPSSPSVYYFVNKDSATLYWDTVPYSRSYNVYDRDFNLLYTLSSTSVVLSDLEPSTIYTYYVSALNEKGESNLVQVTFKTKYTNIPKVNLNPHLSDVSDSTGSWFGSLWFIVAFAVSIPLAFLIANRVKNTFVG